MDQPRPPRAVRRRALAVLVVLVGVLAWTTHGAFTYSGVYRWCSELQMALFGKYVPPISFGLPVVLATAGLARIVRALAPLAGEAAGDSPRLQTWAAESREGQAPPTAALWIPAQRWLMPLAAAAVLGFVGARDLSEARAGRAIERIDAADLEHGTEPKSSWLEVAGTLLTAAAVDAEESYVQSTYVPIVSGQWRPDQPVGVVLRVMRGEEAVPSARAFRGARKPDGLPGFVRAAFETAGLTVGDVLVVELGAEPTSKVTKSTWLLGIAALLALVAAQQWFVWRRRPE